MQEGKILHWGISETTEEYLRKAHAVCPVTCLANGFLAGAFEANKELLTYIENLAKEKQATPAQLSLVWMVCEKPFLCES